MRTILLTAEDQDAEVRLDKFIGEYLENVTRSAAEKLIAEGGVSVNGKEQGKSYRCAAGDIVKVDVPDP